MSFTLKVQEDLKKSEPMEFFISQNLARMIFLMDAYHYDDVSALRQELSAFPRWKFVWEGGDLFLETASGNRRTCVLDDENWKTIYRASIGTAENTWGLIYSAIHRRVGHSMFSIVMDNI